MWFSSPVTDMMLAPPPPPPAPRPGAAARGWAIALGIVLVLALGGVGVLTAFLLQTQTRLDDTTTQLENTTDELEERERRLDEQREQLDEKEVFGESMGALMSTAQRFDGVPMASVIDFDRIEELAEWAWLDRHDIAAVREHTAAADALHEELAAKLASAEARLATNASGSVAETLLDELGRGFVETVWGDAAAVCESAALGCVWSGEPLVVHLDVEGFGQPYRTSWGHTLVAYHEFAHVLQFTNPDSTGHALAAFGDDRETMADCYALTMLDAWSLQERVPASGTSYWDVSYGYGHVCDDGQRDVIRDWMTSLGVQARPVSQ